MIVDCISDTHGFLPKLEGGDLLIIAGDLTANDTYNDWIKCDDWIRSQKYKYKKIVIVAGNHDSYLYDGFDNPFFLPFSDYEPASRDKIPFADYLCDSGTEFEYIEKDPNPFPYDMHPSTSASGPNIPGFNHIIKKFKIWGSPWTLRFPGMNPHAMAFTVDTEEELAEKFSMIPDDIDILVTHSPPYQILDTIRKHGPFSHEREANVGSLSLLMKASGLPNLKLFVCGHIHEGYGTLDTRKANNELKDFFPNPMCKSFPIIVNASYVNEQYQPVNKPIRIEL
jgi:Calcineurin-like phosphoesterase